MDTEKPLVLVVDDQVENTLALEHLLIKLSVQVLCVNSGEKALQYAKELTPSLILLDMEMPDMSGGEVFFYLQSDAKTSFIPIVPMLSNAALAQLESDEKSESLPYSATSQTSFNDSSQLKKESGLSAIASHRTLHEAVHYCLEYLVKPIRFTALKKIIDLYVEMEAPRRLVCALHNNNEDKIALKDEGILGLNDAGDIVYTNNSACGLLQLKPSQMIGLSFESLLEEPVNGVCSDWWDHPIYKICTDDNSILQVESARFWSGYGTQLQVKFAVVPVLEPSLVSLVVAFKVLGPGMVDMEPIDEAYPIDDISSIEPNSIQEISIAVPEEDALVEMSCMQSDLAEMTAEESRIDPVTGLSAAAAFTESLSTLLFEVEQNLQPFSLFNLNVDYFRYINQGVGWDFGDLLLDEIAQRLEFELMSWKQQGRISGFEVSRVQADEFLMGVCGLANAGEEASFSESLLKALGVPFQIKENELYISASIGIATYPFSGTVIDELITSSQQAMQHKKNSGGDGYHFDFISESKELVHIFCKEKSFQEMLTEQLKACRVSSKAPLKVVYQMVSPVNHQNENAQVSSVSVEWHSVEYGVVDHEECCQLAHKLGVYEALMSWLIESVLQKSTKIIYPEADLAQSVLNPEVLRVSFDVYPDLLLTEDFSNNIQGLIEKYQFSSSRLLFELSEERVSDTLLLQQLKQSGLYSLGVGFVLSNFGKVLAPLAALRNPLFSYVTLYHGDWFEEVSGSTGTQLLKDRQEALRYAVNEVVKQYDLMPLSKTFS